MPGSMVPSKVRIMQREDQAGGVPTGKARLERHAVCRQPFACLRSLGRTRRVGLLRLLGVMQAEEVCEAGARGGKPLFAGGGGSGLDDEPRCSSAGLGMAATEGLLAAC